MSHQGRDFFTFGLTGISLADFPLMADLRVNYSEAQMFLERVEIVVAVEEGMPLGHTEGSYQAVDGLADRMAA